MSRTGLTRRTARYAAPADAREGHEAAEPRPMDRDRVDRVLMMLLIAGAMAAMAVALNALEAMTGR